MPKSKRKSKKVSSSETLTLSLKEQLAQNRKAELERKQLINYTIFASLGAALVGLLVAFVDGDPKVAVGATFALLILSLSLKYPRQALWAFLIYLPFAGTVVYALGNSLVLQLAKDAFYFPALIGTVQYCQRKRLPILIPKSLMPPLGILLAFCLLTLFFVNGSQALEASQTLRLADQGTREYPFLVGILGLKVFLGYVPLIICAYYLLRNKQEFLFLTRLFLVLTLICCGLGFIQYMFLRTGRCEGTRLAEGAALFTATPQARCFVGGSLLYSPEYGQIRLPGTFVAPWQWAWFLISNAFFSFASAFSDPSLRWRIAGLVSMATVVVSAVISGQRIALGLVPVIFAILLVLTGQIVNLKRFLPVLIGLAIILGIAAVTYPEIVQERVNSFSERWNASPPQEFIVDQFQFTWKRQRSLLGNGLGRATGSARYLGETVLVETYYPKVLHEIGPFGLLAFVGLVSTLTFLTFKAYRSVRDASLRSYGACFWVFVLFISYNTYYYPLDVDPVAVYYWFFAGVILKLPALDKLEQLKEAQDLPQNKHSGRRSRRKSQKAGS